MSVCFERGGKISASNDRNVAFLDDGSIELFCYESLSLVATIYKDTSGKYLVRKTQVAFIMNLTCCCDDQLGKNWKNNSSTKEEEKPTNGRRIHWNWSGNPATS